MITTVHSDQNASPPRLKDHVSPAASPWPTAEKIRLVEETMQPGCRCPMWPGVRASLPACCSTGLTNARRRPAGGLMLFGLDYASASSRAW